MYRSKIELHNVDCLPFMKQCEDKQFDLAIVDPPYGILKIGMKITKPSRPNSYKTPPKHAKKDWDNNRPSKEYFAELQRISKNQIIWGGNYFADLLSASGCWFFWDKINGDGSHFADGEFAWTSLKTSSKKFKCSVFDGLRGGKDRIHPTEKPKKLYDWILENFTNEADKIIDTHLGSGSIALSCWDRKFDLVGIEIDKEYFDNASKRLNQHKKQLTFF
jgi:site-specific DNA-methyltransferase (adenine-specific)